VDGYGAIGVIKDGTVSRLVPEDIGAVMIAYCTDPTFAPGEERGGPPRGGSTKPARDCGHKIYRALRHGELELRARRNGSGDVETIASNQGLSLKFQSWNGRDLALPINVKKDNLNLPRAFEDYVNGRVPAHVWPDPHFIAAQVLQIWPRHEPTQVALAVEVPTRTADELALSDRPEGPDGVSDRAWETYVAALEMGLDLGIHGNITSAARSIAQSRGHRGEHESERRSLHRVLEALRKKTEQYLREQSSIGITN
jgi:hypothetical protein